MGRAIPAAEVRKILESLEFGVEEIAPRTFSVIVPSWRATKDVSIKDDLVEEVGRMIGYDSITPVAPLTPARVPPANPSVSSTTTCAKWPRRKGSPRSPITPS